MSNGLDPCRSGWIGGGDWGVGWVWASVSSTAKRRVVAMSGAGETQSGEEEERGARNNLWRLLV